MRGTYSPSVNAFWSRLLCSGNLDTVNFNCSLNLDLTCDFIFATSCTGERVSDRLQLLLYGAVYSGNDDQGS